MTQADLYLVLESLGLPVAYGQFESTENEPAPPPPFITYQFSYSSDLIADNHNYVSIENFQIELYTAKKDLAAEKLVQDKLKELQLPYRKTEAWLDGEKLWQIIYEIQLLGG
ncbi:hypothetical protein [Brevibacillus choshinensis]|uniref:Phage tail protein n=1 Tax=Brevibacillus choshinensis TaxID=54911 RepID=A0ABX7FL18_BRECH|nr:hypothetical protein [Brevibacillus choshinensis]QRG66933.1 hypothetical protein JNE38_26220 [Brevibacillus choshinensis]